MTVGMMALEDSARVDFTRLRTERRRRLFEGIEAAGLDAVVLGRSGNVRYASGARQLWRSGTFPFAPVCVVVRETRRVHLLSVWDEGIPPEISHDDLYGMFWNPAHLLGALAEIPGLGAARRIGTDSLTPFFAQALPTVAPRAELADGSGVVARARAIKTPDEIACLTMAAALAEAGLSALESALVPGVTERELLAVYDECVARLGAPTPPSESVAFATPRRGPVRFSNLAGDRPVGDDELVVLSPGALYAGYEAGVARTRPAGTTPPPGTADLAARCGRGLEALVGACRPGNTGADLYRAWESTGEPEAAIALAHGMGIGAEAPLIGFGRGA
ncbi:MAG TPA: M24 family metallopeptidase, partial [Acidimicrobiales bacterium]|nr:M24 family metallopeptidase [Acidimicrobiales bacterium]